MKEMGIVYKERFLLEIETISENFRVVFIASLIFYSFALCILWHAQYFSNLKKKNSHPTNMLEFFCHILRHIN